SPTQSVAAPAAVPAAASLPARADAHKPIVPASAVPSAATPTLDAARAPGAAAVPAAAAPAAANTAERANPDDYAPAAEPSAAAGGLGHVRRGTQSGVPLYQQAAAAPGNQLPQLRLDLHAYAEKARDRWVMINMHKLHEGDSLPEGVRVERITPDGAVLSYRGSQFLLSRD
ncbi:MAG: general secretion pathway protein GspB, partial [Candidatus Dormibacteria bacterium]